ncbi:MAG: sulfatase-like hydrolase/transferase, partial [Kiritimatiellia bacterium]|nr:sulfatase-like hydrolase/transferase [Kiritimatiellia bacterium]
NHLLELEGENIVDGFNRRGYDTWGTGSVRWFNPKFPATRPLVQHFQEYYYPGRLHFLEDQVEWVDQKLSARGSRPTFLFMNIGETHVPYWHKDAAWDPRCNPCDPKAPDQNDRDECMRRQRACLEYVDAKLGALLQRLQQLEFSFLICSDHGDCWGEDGLWEHGINHPAVFEVPLITSVAASSA